MQISIEHLRGWRAEVGCICPLPRMHREWDVVAPKGIRFSDALMQSPAELSIEALRKMGESAAAEAKKLNLAGKCELIVFCCTSGSFAGGTGYDQLLIGQIVEAAGSPATTTITCVLELFKDMNIKRIALVGPYTDPVLEEETKFLKANGFKVLYLKGLGLKMAPDYMRYMYDPDGCVSPIVKDAARAAPDIDCIFVTCMMSSILGIVDALEADTEKPIISSLSATLYGILKKLGINDPVYHYGQALRRPRL